jgi:hypothetical protein
VDTLEHASFSQPPRDQDLHDKLDILESRLLEMEGKTDEHARLFSRIDVERSDVMIGKRRDHPTNENASFVSDNSSVTSSALLLATEERKSLQARVSALEERLAEVERTAPPSIARPLEIEVVLIPWGRELRGLWVSPNDQLKHSSSKFTTQDSEEWTNARSVRSSSRMSLSLRATAESGWSSQAIHDWAEDTDEWLVPRACGVKSVVYHRLKSRGFVKQVELTKSGAKETQEVIGKAFGDLLATLSADDPDHADEDNIADEQGPASILGLAASFIPLRKVHGSSRLRFLAKSEMVTPALWTAEFLASSVIMRATGGLKRLFITHRESYLQRNGTDCPSWTWPMLRQLRRASAGDDVEEADARESYWAVHSVLDAPPLSVNTSFGSQASHHSQPLAETQVNPDQHEEEANASPTHLKQESVAAFSDEPLLSRPKQPITPLSEFSTQTGVVQHPTTPHPTNAYQFNQQPQHQPRYNLRHHHRTVSVPLTNTSKASSAVRTSQQQQPRSFSAQSKRIRSFEIPSNPLIAQLPSFIPSSPARHRGSGSTSNKRQKLDTRPSTPAEDQQQQLERLRQLRSRSASASVGLTYGVIGGGGAKRGVTPTAYATPFSGNFTAGSGFGASIPASAMSGRSEGVGEVESDGEDWKGVADEEDGEEDDGGERGGGFDGDDCLCDDHDDDDDDDEEEEGDFDVEGGLFM